MSESEKKEDMFKLWTSEENIERSAKNYKKWYISCRFIPVLVYFILTVAGVLLERIFDTNGKILDVNSILFLTSIFLPLMFFSARGYRWAIVLALIGYSIGVFSLVLEKLYMMIQNGSTLPYTGLIIRITIWFMMAKAMISAIRIESYRIKQNLAVKQSTLKNIMIAIVLFIIPCGCMMAHAIWEQVYVRAMYQHTIGLEKFCKENGYTMKKYPLFYVNFLEHKIKNLDDGYAQLAGKELISTFVQDYDIDVDLNFAKAELDGIILRLENAYHKKFTIIDACRWVDENSQKILQNL